MVNGRTPERWAKQAEVIKRWKPWSQSTGPRTEKGKAVTSQNALVHGLRSASWLEERRRVNGMLGECRMRLKRVCRCE
jgi:hypothetical protein